MVVMANKRSVMTLYTSADEMYSHQTRIVLAEKGVSVDYLLISNEEIPQDLADINPYSSLPTLVDRDLVLFESRIIMEYLDERFPHPPLLPIYPVARSQARLMMHRLDYEWYGCAKRILTAPDSDDASEARIELKDSIMNVVKVFTDFPYFLSEDFTLMDCCIMPLLWRLPLFGIELTSTKAKPIIKYMDKVFARDSFQASLTEAEQDIRG
jgi:RNA polymerase-associated protein